MARSRKKKRRASQKAVGVASAALPGPLRRLLGNRLVASLVVLAVPALLLTGIVTVTWSNGKPEVSIERERAKEVKQKLADAGRKLTEKVQALRAGESVDGPPLGDFVPAIGAGRSDRFTARPEWLKFDESSKRIAERIIDVSDRLKQAATSGTSLDLPRSDDPPAAAPGDTDGRTTRKIRPLFQFR